MRNIALLITLSALAALSACQSQPPAPPPSHAALQEEIRNGAAVDIDLLRASFRAQEDFPDALKGLVELEQQALVIMADEPLKLGAIGSGILDRFHGSLTGHYAMLKFYEHVGSEDAAEPHRQWLERIQTAISAGDGEAESPYRVFTQAEAHAHLLIQGEEPVGGIYQSTDDTPFMLLLIGKPAEGPLTRGYYDVSSMFEAFEKTMVDSVAAVDRTPFTLIGLLARESDTAAQAAVGAFLASRQRFEDATGWLRASSRSGNVLANSLLARLFYEQSKVTEDAAEKEALLNDTLDNYVHAIALGSSDAMYSLAALYLGEQYGAENIEAGIPLLTRAAGLEHSDAMLYLGHLHAAGEHVPQSDEKASGYFLTSSELGNRRALGAYARFLVSNPEADADNRVLEWLEAFAEQRDAEAMLLLGNLHARGVATEADQRAAVRWFKQAVKTDPRDANIINEVAWTLTVSDVEGLPDPRYAKRIMDPIMRGDPEAGARPEYLDTWAAIYAANGDFERAVEIQEQALTRARELERDDVLSILEEHLEKFRSGEVIIEAAP